MRRTFFDSIKNIKKQLTVLLRCADHWSKYECCAGKIIFFLFSDRKETNECNLITNYSLDQCVKRKNKPNKELNLYDCVAGAFLYDDSEMTEHGKN